MKKSFTASSSRGSALLIVLGFLSFMMISAVSFAIYMRIERQASSNYRHALVARHLLTSALTRSIAEVDLDLDPDLLTDKIQGDVFRFPSHSSNWEGNFGKRFYLSGRGTDNGFARVVSFDALGYVPALFMNDLRYHGADARWVQLGAPAERVRDSTVNNGIPTFQFGGESVVGRYAFTCLNMSDLLNVNMCTDLSVRNTASNRVCVSYLLSPAAISDLKTRFKDDVYYPTILDFYAGMHQPRATVFPDSPYHAWASGAQMKESDILNDINHVFVTDGFARIQKPRTKINGQWQVNSSACNIKKKSVSTSLVGAAWNTEFKKAMDGAFKGWNEFADSANESMFSAILADYLAAPSSAPMQLDIPSVKMAPMVYKIELSGAPETFTRPEGTPPNQKNVKYLRPFTRGGNSPLDLVSKPGNVTISLMFPFRNSSILGVNNKFSVDAELSIYLFKDNPSSSTAPVFIGGDGIVLQTIKGTAECSLSAVKTQDEALSSFSVSIPITVDTVSLTATYDAQNIRVVLVPFIKIRQNNVYFDCVPCTKSTKPAVQSDHRSYADVPRLYFQQKQAFAVSETLIDGRWDLEYPSLTCPDPRYNFAAANWYPAGSDINTILKDQLLGKDGRDSDVFMFVSGQGELQSPGELGFLARPYRNDSAKYTVFSDALKNRTLEQLADYKNFYRTIRLYDHGGTDPKTQLQDPVYEWFYAANEDDSVDGARINPHSDLPMVLKAAIEKTPLDYYYAYENRGSTTHEQKTFNSLSGWNTVSEKWFSCMTNSQVYLYDAKTPYYENKLLYEIYGSSQAPYNWGWYSGDTKRIFNTPLSSGGDLFEVDRKMLYSFSLESFSDRQQLFLYVIQAEATGSAAGSSSKSLAGGRAIAVVWRDPDVNTTSKRHDTQILYYRQLDN